jgi:ABC-type lipoprotein export system ATPase subunit
MSHRSKSPHKKRKSTLNILLSEPSEVLRVSSSTATSEKVVEVNKQISLTANTTSVSNETILIHDSTAFAKHVPKVNKSQELDLRQQRFLAALDAIDSNTHQTASRPTSDADDADLNAPVLLPRIVSENKEPLQNSSKASVVLPAPSPVLRASSPHTTKWRWYDSNGEGPITRFLRADDPTVALPTLRVIIMLLLGFLLSASVIWLSEDEFFEGTTDHTQKQHLFDFPVHVAFQDVGCSISNLAEPSLYDLTGSIPPGKLTGILGQSGSGKTLFSYQLLGRGKKVCSHANHGRVYLNGRPRSLEAFLDRVGFVPQDDILYGDLTVEESLQFSASWRLPRLMSEQEKMEIVNETISILNLNRVRDSNVGTVRKRGISGGERRRVSIGIELVARPSVLIAVSKRFCSRNW